MQAALTPRDLNHIEPALGLGAASKALRLRGCLNRGPPSQSGRACLPSCQGYILPTSLFCPLKRNQSDCTQKPYTQVDATPGPRRQVFVVGVGAAGSGDLAQSSKGHTYSGFALETAGPPAKGTGHGAKGERVAGGFARVFRLPAPCLSRQLTVSNGLSGCQPAYLAQIVPETLRSHAASAVLRRKRMRRGRSWIDCIR